jgi:lysophospholipase L1-like esterase
MRQGRRLASLLVLIAAFSIGGAETGSNVAAAPSPMPLISRGVPVYASSQIYPATYANDSSYGTNWRGTVPGWIALDLSRVPVAQRHQVIVAWYNDPATSPYDHTLVGDVAYNNLRDYTIDANTAPGGTAAPTSGWVTLATVAGNRYHSRSQLVDLTGYNWVRLNITAGDGSSGNNNAAINLDVHDASQGVQDSWIFYGDSVTEDGMFHYSDGSTVGNFAQLINASRPGNYPAYEDGGTWGLWSTDGAQHMVAWLTAFPGKNVGLAYGTNDANACGNTTTFYNNYVTMVQAVLAAGKIPVVPTIPWARTANVQSCGPGFNAKIQALYAAYPQIVHGPDLWTFFSTNQSLIGSDNLHPSTAGYGAYRQQWANAMLANVYAAGSGPAVTLTPTALAFGSQLQGTTSAPQSATLRNSGTAPLAISAITLGGANSSDFNSSNTCPASLAVNATCTISATFTPSAQGSRIAGAAISDDAPGSPQTLGLSGTGTNTAITFDKSLGSSHENIGSTTTKLTTTAPAVARSRVFVFVTWNSATRTLASVSGGGLAWSLDVQARDASSNHGAIASAYAPSGLASGTSITATFSGSVGHGLMAASSFTGIAPTGALDATGTNTQGGVSGWAASVTTTTASDVILGWSGIDTSATSTATAPNAEMHDFGDQWFNEYSTSVYRIDSTAGTKTVNGTWSGNTGSTANVTVAAAYKAG